MTTQEFSNTFDTTLNSYSEGASITLDEYEKSVFLTKAQEEIVMSYYTGKNPLGEGFEKTEEVRRYLDGLIERDEINPTTPGNDDYVLDSTSKLITLPTNLWFITYEAAKVTSGSTTKILEVVPITQDSFNRIKENPFKYTTSRRILRLDFGLVETSNSTSNKVELVCGDNTISKYLIRYIAKPSPIILTDLTGSGLTINGQTNEATCTLHEGLHKLILDRAVQLAIASRSTGK